MRIRIDVGLTGRESKVYLDDQLLEGVVSAKLELHAEAISTLELVMLNGKAIGNVAHIVASVRPAAECLVQTSPPGADVTIWKAPKA